MECCTGDEEILGIITSLNSSSFHFLFHYSSFLYYKIQYLCVCIFVFPNFKKRQKISKRKNGNDKVHEHERERELMKTLTVFVI